MLVETLRAMANLAGLYHRRRAYCLLPAWLFSPKPLMVGSRYLVYQ